ncbi:hypothetical protein [Anaeromicropila herbilytica]|uniref:Uncharacterized protein n=1 Tax=Anaeromicropila herbilytica TaxID=2785025 RepID=A0A7R7EI82_9FIRM|nr:hypothetical protein [Anaeromicropila herbilytica]BCN29336.1 hypothetical protein bsdtb5_06310 [Anaeromicropila herbilytica]
MKIEKKVISNLSKCYSIAPLTYKGTEHILIAAEKVDRCLLFDLDGNLEDTVFSEPGGVMSMVQVPGSDGQFLATHKFYSPNDSKEAKIVIITPIDKGNWEVRTLVELPHVHRFDIVSRSGVNYLIACTLKSGHEYKDDWSNPGKVYAAVLPNDLSKFDEEHQLQLTVIKDNMLKNHGYYRVNEKGIDTSVVSADCGVFQFIPPNNQASDWEVKELLSTPASDAVLVDFDNDGEKELAVLSPFHGDQISIYKKKKGTYELEYQYEKKAEFTHAIYGGNLCGKPSLIVGHRQGERNLIVFTYNENEKKYESQIIDKDCGPANVYRYVNEDKDILIATNREIDEVAMYILQEE